MTETDEAVAAALRVIGASDADFTRLLELAGLDPQSDLRFQDWSGIDFGDTDVSGFDFTGANLKGCDFTRTVHFDLAIVTDASLKGAKLPAREPEDQSGDIAGADTRSNQKQEEVIPRITVVGVGGVGCTAVNSMISSNLSGLNFVAIDTDAKRLGQSKADHRIRLKVQVDQGLFIEPHPDSTRVAVDGSIDEVIDAIGHVDMCVIAADTKDGAGAAPVIASAARKLGVLTVGVVTEPIGFDGRRRMRQAVSKIEDVIRYFDTLIIIPTQTLLRAANDKTASRDALKTADEALQSYVRIITDTMVMPGLIDLDFSDIRFVLDKMGLAMVGTGEAGGKTRAINATEAAIDNAPQQYASLKTAKGALINITGGFDMTLFEVDEAANRLREELSEDADIILSSIFDEKMDGTMRVSVVATGITADWKESLFQRAQASFAAPRLGPLGPNDSAVKSNPEDELLDIPAFLRRQPKDAG